MKRTDLSTRALRDVAATLPADNEVLAWDATAGLYIPAPISGSGGLFDPTNILINASLSGALRVYDGTDDWIRVNTDTPAISLGNTTDNPVFNLLGTGRVAKVTGSNMLFGHMNTVPAGATNYVFGDLTAVTTTTGDSHVFIGRLTNTNLSAPRVVAISAAGMTGSPGNDSVTVQGSGSAGATGNRAVSIGGAGVVSGNDSQALGYGHSLTHANCIGLGRAATSTAANQFIVGSASFPTSSFYLGEGVTRATPMTSANVNIQPTEVTGTNAAGVPLYLLGGRGTGNAAGGSIVLRTYPAGASGPTAHTAATRLEIDSSGAFLIGGTAGTSGQALFSQGAGVAPNWADIPVTPLTLVDIPEDDPSAYQIWTGSGAGDNYLLIDTTIGDESIQYGNDIVMPRHEFLGGNGVFFGTNPIQVTDNLLTAFRIREGTNNYIDIRTTNGSETITLGNATTNPDFIWLGSGEWQFGGSAGTSGYVLTSNGAGAAPTWQAASGGAFDPEDIEINPSLSGALLVHDGTQDWLRFNTDTPLINIGNTTDNPAFTFLGSGVLTLPTGGIDIPDNNATPFRVREGTRSYISVVTTNGAESVDFGNATTNPDYTFAGNGTVTLPSAGIDIPDNTAGTNGAFVVKESSRQYIKIVTTNGAETMSFGNTTTNPVFELLGTGRVAKATGSNMMFGYFNTVPTGTAIYVFGDLTAVTSISNNDKVLVGRHTNANLSNARFVAIAAAGGTGSYGSDSVTVQSAGGAGATGNRSVSIGGAGTVSGADSQALGYGHSITHSECVGLGRGATSTAAGQFVLGSGSYSTPNLYLGEGVTKASALTATAINIQPTEHITTSNGDGVPLNLFGGRGTGTGNGSSATAGALNLVTYPSTGSSGTTQHTATTRVKVRADGTVLQCSHNTMGTAEARDQARHWQTGNVATPDASTVYVIATIAPEDTAGNDKLYAAKGTYVAWTDTGVKTLSCFEFLIMFEIVAGVASITAWHQLSASGVSTNGTGSSVNFRSTGATIEIIATTTGGHLDGEASCAVAWHGIDQEV